VDFSTARDRLSERLLQFCWEQWAQMGVSAPVTRNDGWAADPEALILFTLEVGRDDPRLLDEVLDWVHANERWLSVQRLRNLAREDEDRALVEAALGWAAQWRSRPRLKARPPGTDGEPVPYFRTLGGPVPDPDPAFLAAGFLKPASAPSGKSQAPDLGLPINFALRMRAIFGVGGRAEVARVLVCSRALGLSAQELANLTGFAKRNVQEALSGLRDAGVVSSSQVANEQRFEAPRERWEEFLALPIREIPVLIDWPALLHALRTILRWFRDPRNESLSPYMQTSEARALLDEVGQELLSLGIEGSRTLAPGTEIWPRFLRVVDEVRDLVE